MIIAVFVHDKFIRPYVGDVLVVILIYCFFKIFIRGKKLNISLYELLFACLVELLQYLKLINYLKLQDSNLARTIIGHSASWIDIVAYTAGFIVIILFEKHVHIQFNSSTGSND